MNFHILLPSAREMAPPISPTNFTRFKISAFQLWLLFSLSIFETASAQTIVTPAQYLASQPAPYFAPGHHLPPLTRWGWCLDSNTMVEFATNWGYALALDNYTTSATVSNVLRPGTFDWGIAQLIRNNPGKYKLQVNRDTTFPVPIPSGFYCTNANGWFVDISGTNSWQYITNTAYHPVPCPEGPDSYWQYASSYWMSNLLVINSNAPIDVILTDGEYGIGAEGANSKAWYQDPRVQAATNAYIGIDTGVSHVYYSTARQCHQLGFINAAIDQLLPNRDLNIYYYTGNEQSRYAASPIWYSNAHPPVNWFQSFDSWEPMSSNAMVTNTDLPSFECYYTASPSGGEGGGASSGYGWLPATNPWPHDLLTEYTDAVGYNIGLGHSNNYSWVCGGWSQGNGASDFSDLPHYMGFLKCCYTAGMVGGVAGYFVYPTNGFSISFPATNPPPWILQMMALSQVHALFWKFDNCLTNGTLLSGPQMHEMAGDQPAYEFTNTAADASVRVFARQFPNPYTNQCLITAWAITGADRPATVTIPNLGSVTLLARDCGSVYLATATNLTLIDTNGMLPTDAFSTAPTPPTDLHIIPGITDQ